jgi:hypothetical protein
MNDELDRLRRFAAAVLESWPLGDVDGGELQELAVKQGLLIPTTVTAPCGEGCNCADYYGDDELKEGVVCYRRAPEIEAARTK